VYWRSPCFDKICEYRSVCWRKVLNSSCTSASPRRLLMRRHALACHGSDAVSEGASRLSRRARSCERDGTRDETIIAIVKTTDTEWYDTVRSAFRANLSTGRFEERPPRGCGCRNEGWGV